MIKLLYSALIIHMLAFTFCVVSFVITSDIFQYILAVFNLGMLANTLRIAIEMEL